MKPIIRNAKPKPETVPEKEPVELTVPDEEPEETEVMLDGLED